MESQLREELQSKEAEISGLREELRRCQEQEGARQMLSLLLQLQWRCGPYLPFEMNGYVQSVLVQGKVYVSGGYYDNGSENNYIVMEYDTCSGKWDKLPPYRTVDFAMTVVKNQLVLVGGCDQDENCRKVLGVWSKEWTHPYPEMPTARSHCSAVVYNEWLVVAGGLDDSENAVSCVEVMNTDTKQWHTGPPTSEPWSGMKTAVVGDVCYFMGGMIQDDLTATDKVYSVSLPDLILNSTTIWNESQLNGIAVSAPVFTNGALLAVGGAAKDGERVKKSDIHFYTGKEWVKVGDLPYPQCDCTCVMLNNGELFVAGCQALILGTIS